MDREDGALGFRWPGPAWPLIACGLTLCLAVPARAQSNPEKTGSYDATPAESGITDDSPGHPIDASQAQPIEGPGAGVGAPDEPPLPTPLDSDGDGYYDYAEENEAGGDRLKQSVHPADSPWEVNRRHYPKYRAEVRSNGCKKWCIARSSPGGSRPRTPSQTRMTPGHLALGIVVGGVGLAAAGYGLKIGVDAIKEANELKDEDGGSVADFAGKYCCTVRTVTPAGATSLNGEFGCRNDGYCYDSGQTFKGWVDARGSFDGETTVCQGCLPIDMRGRITKDGDVSISGQGSGVSQEISGYRCGNF